jgi:hypothetical protein
MNATTLSAVGFGGVSRAQPVDNPILAEDKRIGSIALRALGELQGNAETTLEGNEPVLAVCNGGPLARNLGSGTTDAVMLAGVAGAAALAGSIITAGGLLFSGLWGIRAGLKILYPESIKKLKQAEIELAQNPEDEVAKQAVKMENLGVLNQKLYLGMSAAQTAVGAVGVASLAGKTPLPISLAGNSVGVLAAATGFALGAVYIARGGVLFKRGNTNRKMVREFQEGFHQKNTVEEAMGFMRAEDAKGVSYLNRRVDPGCLTEKIDACTTKKYTATGVVEARKWIRFTNIEQFKAKLEAKYEVVPEYEYWAGDDGSIFASSKTVDLEKMPKEVLSPREDISEEGIPGPPGKIFTRFGVVSYTKRNYEYGEENEYLERVNRGIHSEKFKHKLTMVIGVAMIVGGILTILATIFSGGIAALAIGLASGIVFMLCEGAFLTYDWSKALNWMRDKSYAKYGENKNRFGVTNSSPESSTRISPEFSTSDLARDSVI